MPNINVDMKSTADFAVKSARERFQKELDYSDQTIPMLENITTQIYWGFSSRTENAREDGLVYNTAVIWGSYLGEYMRKKWGGTWMIKGSDPLISINELEFSPISLIYKKITTNPEIDLNNFVLEASKKIAPVIIASKPPPQPTTTAKVPAVLIASKPAIVSVSKQKEQPRTIDKRLVLALAGFGGLLLVTIACIIGYTMVKAGSLSMFGLFGSDPGSNTEVPIDMTTITPTSAFSDTPYFTPTLLPTYTPRPSATPLSTFTASPTFTEMASLTPTETLPTITPTRTPAPTRPTRTPTNTAIPATEVPPATKTNPPPPPPTEPPPPVLSSCEISPSLVPAGVNTPIKLIAHFSAPGYSFNGSIQGNYPGANGCNATDTNRDGTAECDGSSGLLPSSTRVEVKFSSSIGECTASYSSP